MGGCLSKFIKTKKSSVEARCPKAQESLRKGSNHPMNFAFDSPYER